jgi:hypothetical protein
MSWAERAAIAMCSVLKGMLDVSKAECMPSGVLRRRTSHERAVNFIIRALIKFGVLKDDWDYHFSRINGDHLPFLDTRSGLTMKRRPRFPT